MESVKWWFSKRLADVEDWLLTCSDGQFFMVQVITRLVAIVGAGLLAYGLVGLLGSN